MAPLTSSGLTHKEVDTINGPMCGQGAFKIPQGNVQKISQVSKTLDPKFSQFKSGSFASEMLVCT